MAIHGSSAARPFAGPCWTLGDKPAGFLLPDMLKSPAMHIWCHRLALQVSQISQISQFQVLHFPFRFSVKRQVVFGGSGHQWSICLYRSKLHYNALAVAFITCTTMQHMSLK